MITCLRSLLEEYEKSGVLKHVRVPVSSEHEVAAVMKKTRGEIPMVFEKVDNYTCPLVCGLGGTRELLARSMGIGADELVSHLRNAMISPLPVKRVQQAACQQNVVTPPFDLDAYFPVLKYYQKDSGRFLISGIMTAHDRSGQKLYTSIRRMQYLGKNRCTVLITSTEMKEQFAYYERQRKPMDIAFMFGVVPAVVLGSQISTHFYNMNKLDVTGALLGRPLDVTRCKTVEIDVLAEAEVVLEGRVTQWIKETEGPFGEMCSYYGRVSPQPVVEFTALTYRNNPVFQTFFPSGGEEKLPMAINREVTLYSTVQQTVPGIQAVHITPGGAGRLHAVIQIRKDGPGDGKQAALAAFASDKDLKHVVVVDEDVDLFDPAEVEWAIATRVQADRDIFIVGGASGSPLEPSHCLTGTTAKMGIDATCPLENKTFERTHIPGEDKIKLSDYIQ